jgi:SAM-dependent methyltransferase
MAKARAARKPDWWWAIRNQVNVMLGRHRPPPPYVYVNETEARTFGWFRMETGELLPGFRITVEDTVVDVGCGEGGTCHFAGELGAAVVAVDINPSMIGKVRRRLEGCPARSLQTYLSESTPLPLPSGIATRVVCQEVLEHVEDPAAVLAELVRVGCPGARYLLSVPDAASEGLQKKLAPPIYWQKGNHVRVFGREQFARLVEDAGLVIEQRLLYSFFWSMWWTLMRAYGPPEHDYPFDFPFGAPGTPVLRYWNKTWQALLDAPNGERVRKALEEAVPKSQILIARK